MMSNVAEYFSVRDMTVIFERIFIGIRFLGGGVGWRGEKYLLCQQGISYATGSKQEVAF